MGVIGIHAQLAGSIGIGLINLIMTVVAMLIVDKLGRRTLLLHGFAYMTCSLLLFGTLLPYSSDTIISILLLSLLVVFIMSYAISIGCIFWIVIAEIYPLRIRSRGMCLAASMNWLTNFFVSVSFLSIGKSLGFEYCFIIYAILCGLGFIFIYHIVPETKQMSLEQIEKNIDEFKYQQYKYTLYSENTNKNR